MMEERESVLELTLSNGEKIISIFSYGSMYPNDEESYLRDLQSNLLSVTSNDFTYHYRSPIFLESELLTFQHDLELLLQGEGKTASLDSTEEEIGLHIKRKRAFYVVDFSFSQIGFKKEKWLHELSFQMNQQQIEQSLHMMKR